LAGPQRTGELTDVIVAGGGPAGCAAAIGLVGLGYEVTLIDRPSRAPRLEGLSKRTLDALASSGLPSAAACASPALERSVFWGGWRGAVNREHLVDRFEMDRAALADARAAGVNLFPGRIHSAVLRGEQWQLLVSGQGARRVPVCGAWLIEARGRAAPHRDLGRGQRGVPTLALARRFRSGSSWAGAALGTWGEGFVWACAHAGSGVLQLFVDPDDRWRGALTGSFHAALEAIRAEAPGFFETLGAVLFEGPVTARDASPRRAAEVAPRRALRIGDAAAAIDPLSGSGVFWALASARAALPVFQTLTRRPEAAAVAQRFLRERVAHHFRHQGELGAAFYAADEHHAESSFFRRRSLRPTREAPRRPRGRIEVRPVVVEGFVAEREVWVTPEHPLGIWQLEGDE